jgi:hypothetical protein
MKITAAFVYALLERTRDPNLDDRYRDVLRIAILPFLYPRPRSDLTAKAPFQMSRQELDETLKAQLEHDQQIKKGHGHLHLVRGPK